MNRLIRCTQDLTIEVEQNKIRLQSKHFTKLFRFNDLNLHPDTCRGLTRLPNREVHFSIKAESTTNSEHATNKDPDTSCVTNKDPDTLRMTDEDSDTLRVTDEDSDTLRVTNKDPDTLRVTNEDSDTLRVTPSQLKLSQNDLVDKIQLLQNKWYCTTCQQKLLADRCILSKVLPLPSENWSDFADMWFCHRHEGDEPVVKTQRFLPKPSECFVGETYILISAKHVQNGAIKVSKDGSLTCSRCGNQLGQRVDTDGVSNGDVYKFFIHKVKIDHLTSDSAIRPPSVKRNEADVFFSRLLLEQCHLYTSYRFIVETSTTNGYKGSGPSSHVSTCLVWLLDSDVTVYKSSSLDQTEDSLQKDHIIKILFKCQLMSDKEQSRPTDYVTKSLISMWRKDNTVHGFTLPHPVFLQFIQLLVDNCKSLSSSQRFLNGFYVSYISKDFTSVK